MPPSMYSHNQQYQQGSSYGVATQQPGMAWNGNSWVPQNQQQHSTYSSHSTYATNTQTHDQQNAVELQTQYTNYYHGWKAKEDAERKRAASLYGDAKQEAERQSSWAKYYSEQASRAAHHYHNTPSVPFPHQLPPAPPLASATTSQPTQQQPPPTRSLSVASATQSPNDGMKEYVHRSLQQCQGRAKDALQAMQKQVEAMISQVCRDGTLHTIDWANKPLLPLPEKYLGYQTQTTVHSKYGASSSPPAYSQVKVSSTSQTSSSGIDDSQSPSNSSYNGNYSNQGKHEDKAMSNGYYGRSSSSTEPQSSYGNYRSKDNGRSGEPSGMASSYYGPSGASPHHNGQRPSSNFRKHDESLQENDSYYGASSAGGDYIELPGKRKKKKQKSPVARRKLQENDSYYGASSAGGDYIELPGKRKKKKQKSPVGHKKLKKMKSSPPDGFQRNANTLSKRADRFAGAGGLKDASSSRTSVDSDFAKYMGAGVIGGKNKKLDEQDFERMKVKGTCQVLEKNYLRLTAPPRAELVRPLAVLERHLQNLKGEYKLPPSKRHDYAWFCSQLKAIRQDLTVQQIFTAFTVDVYECHARIALEEGDLNEFNQCQTQLKELYGNLQDDPKAIANENEFVAYRLVYYVLLTGNKKYEEGSTDLFKIMLTLTASRRSDPTIAHALKVRESVAEFNFHSFFRLYRSCPTKHGELLMKFLLPNVRQWALNRICKAYRPSVEVNFVLEQLGFEMIGDGRKFLESCGCLFLNEDELNTKDTVVRESDLKEQNSLI
eukprot:CAMPEP_0194066152 /NCGR_PEP_ID=MMETSP0009_2-20130614/85862_1 /TAXON_ID=210454 /ORGANISM="Grammatophora oceanica, Strain CCMP 410" /LENGTH=772 /DNA_ID=CAMNT_0038719075 /DNA_START=99 /DNA_END=2418 /DNA_ORIENTATION=-